MTARYGMRRGSVSASFKAYRVEYERHNSLDGLVRCHDEVLYARTQAEAERKAERKYGAAIGGTITRVYCVEK